MAALLTVGGWTGSRYFSTAVGSAENRTQFAHALLHLVDKYDLDGIDIELVFFSAVYRSPSNKIYLAGNIPISRAWAVTSSPTRTHPTSCLFFKNYAPPMQDET